MMDALNSKVSCRDRLSNRKALVAAALSLALALSLLVMRNDTPMKPFALLHASAMPALRGGDLKGVGHGQREGA